MSTEEMERGTNQSMDLIKEYLMKIQSIDEQITDLRAGRSQIMKDAKSDGIDTGKLNKAISHYRAMLKKKDVDISEQEMYNAIVEETGIITTLS